MVILTNTGAEQNYVFLQPFGWTGHSAEMVTTLTMSQMSSSLMYGFIAFLGICLHLLLSWIFFLDFIFTIFTVVFDLNRANFVFVVELCFASESYT